MSADRRRCGWVSASDPLYCAYHDQEWGVAQRDPRALWEALTLEAFQAGLAWITILRKRETLRAAFCGFEPEKVARFGEADIGRLLNDPGVIRSRAKIEAAIAGARIYLDMAARGEDFADYCWGFAPGAPIRTAWRSFRDAPSQTPASQAFARDLKARGFKFLGPTTAYAFMQAVGIVDDHEAGCWRSAG